MSVKTLPHHLALHAAVKLHGVGLGYLNSYAKKHYVGQVRLRQFEDANYRTNNGWNFLRFITAGSFVIVHDETV